MRAVSAATTAAALAGLLLVACRASAQQADRTAEPPAVGTRGHVGCLENPTRLQRLRITEPGVYENYLVDGGFVPKTLVKINADDVVLRNCLIRNGGHNAVTVYAKNVVIENCLIHHALAGTFNKQKDAHGITGRPFNLTVRNCGIYYVSGDCLQFDPDRQAWNDVLVENCILATGPLRSDAAGFRRGERPGENAVDTKLYESHPRARFTMRNCLMYGWGDGQIVNGAALNLKEHIQAEIVGCVLLDNDICFRLRGDNDNRGGAEVTIRDCAIYRSNVGVRMEDAIENLKIFNLAIGPQIARPYRIANGAPRGYVNRGQRGAPKLEDAIQRGVAAAAGRSEP